MLFVVCLYFFCAPIFFFYCAGDHRDLHFLTHSFPPRRSSDLAWPRRPCQAITLRWQPKPAPSRSPRARLRKAPSSLDTRFRRKSFTERHPIACRSEEHTSELQSLMRISYAVFCLNKNTNTTNNIPKYKTQTTKTPQHTS